MVLISVLISTSKFKLRLSDAATQIQSMVAWFRFYYRAFCEKRVFDLRINLCFFFLEILMFSF